MKILHFRGKDLSPIPTSIITEKLNQEELLRRQRLYEEAVLNLESTVNRIKKELESVVYYQNRPDGEMEFTLKVIQLENELEFYSNALEFNLRVLKYIQTLNTTDRDKID